MLPFLPFLPFPFPPVPFLLPLIDSLSTFDDSKGVVTRNPQCFCGTSRLGERNIPSQSEFYCCPVGGCEFYKWLATTTEPAIGSNGTWFVETIPSRTAFHEIDPDFDKGFDDDDYLINPESHYKKLDKLEKMVVESSEFYHSNGPYEPSVISNGKTPSSGAFIANQRSYFPSC